MQNLDFASFQCYNKSMIGFVIAMEKEAEPILRHTRIDRDYISCGRRVVSGELYGESVCIIVCGVGKVNAAAATQYALDTFGPRAIINIGVAGGLNGSVKIGGIYGISRAVQYDFDLTQLNGTDIGTLDEYTENYLTLTADGRYPQRKLATGDRFNDSAADYGLLTETLGADIRDMECGAIVQTCLHAGKKCLAYKIISDIAGSGSTTEQYLKNLSLCFKTLERELEKIINGVKNNG